METYATFENLKSTRKFRQILLSLNVNKLSREILSNLAKFHRDRGLTGGIDVLHGIGARSLLPVGLSGSRRSCESLINWPRTLPSFTILKKGKTINFGNLKSVAA